MSVLRRVSLWLDRWFDFSPDPEVVLAQYAVLKRQVPLLYLVLIITAVAVFCLVIGSAPLWLISSVCAIYVAGSAFRYVAWTWFFPEVDQISVRQARHILLRTTLAVIPISLAYLGYAFVLDQYGGPYERAGLAVCVVLTAIGCIVCLMHLPQAARLVHVMIMLPYIVYHMIAGNDAFVVIAINAAIVTTLMIRVSQNVFDGFTELVTSRAELALQQGKAARLATENASLAMTDALTGLPNRRLFLERMGSCVRQSETSGQPFVVGVIDLDRFKPVNDVYGHAVGDQLLIEVGKRLQSLASERLLVARLGGDEFGLVINDGAGPASAIGDRVVDSVTRPFEIEGHSFQLGCSIGFACFPEAGRSASDLFDRADYALYNIKSKRRGGYAFFTHDLETRLRSETEMEAALLNADLENELAVELQPIVCMRTGMVVGLEALGRWESATLGNVQPSRFIEAAERLNLMERMTTILFGKLLRKAARLPEEQEISFNLSTHDIVTSSTIDILMAAIATYGVRPDRITFEITETALMRDFHAANQNIMRLRALGASIALDDFGTGFSSLSYINQLPIDKVKIDRSFIRNLHLTRDNKLLTAVLGMCETLKLKCIVEGVETEEQLRALTRMGFSMAQGYLFARPMKIDPLLEWLHQNDSAPALPCLSRFGTGETGRRDCMGCTNDLSFDGDEACEAEMINDRFRPRAASL